MLPHNDWTFIHVLNERYPYLQDNFEQAMRIEPEERHDWALDRVYDILRKRYTKRGVPAHDTETVGEHILESIGLATLHTPDHCNRDTVEQMILVHDMPQAITDNIRCEKDISDTDKYRIRHLAAKVIFEAKPVAYDLWIEYEKQESLESHIAHDMQNVQMMLKVLEYQSAYPKITPHFQYFWDNLEHRWKTETGREIYRSTLPANGMDTNLPQNAGEAAA